jgi:hypothetical protein
LTNFICYYFVYRTTIGGLLNCPWRKRDHHDYKSVVLSIKKTLSHIYFRQRIVFIAPKGKLSNSPEFPRINSDLKAFLVRFFEQTLRDVSIDALPAHVCVEKSACHVVTRLSQRVPKLSAVPRAPRGSVEEVRGGEGGGRSREIENERKTR